MHNILVRSGDIVRAPRNLGRKLGSVSRAYMSTNRNFLFHMGRSININTHTRTCPLDSFSTCSIQASSIIIINTSQFLQTSLPLLKSPTLGLTPRTLQHTSLPPHQHFLPHNSPRLHVLLSRHSYHRSHHRHGRRHPLHEARHQSFSYRFRLPEIPRLHTNRHCGRHGSGGRFAQGSLRRSHAAG